MSYLLDTSALIIWATNDRRLTAKARAVIEDEFNAISVSVVAAYEISYKTATRKLDPRLDAEIWSVADQAGFQWIPVDRPDAHAAAGLDSIERDPWDRIIAAQAIRRGLTVVSIDDAFDALGAPRLW